ncbi:DUF3006 domain-containing protein [Virgibacillus sp. 179-BFC.A HS]|uniref:DUF3006 domain-containing protein n=1 Tax=Tigheibacillus jepli TaxID=3035914 RepID=A0ABU5CF43_9BACI|nr:DUF3006 domain-containing protein [Virgibacillus sp. 179-BFC.A HS]MDY0404934.1 DUF3006 domain-containing protein [Virgibacillus sp. 179-BFC.A HS]
MRYTIDQMEGEIAVCEDDNGNTVDIARNKLPKHAKVGDVLLEANGTYKLDKKTTKQRRKEIEKLMDDVWED